MKRKTKLPAMLVLSLILSLLFVTPTVAANVQISGTVTNQSGFGIASVTVAVLDGMSNIVASATTDMSGHYTLSVPSETYLVRATPAAGSNYQTATAPSQSFTGDTTVDLTLIPVTGTFAIIGTLRDALGNGVPGQQISISGQAVMTDTNGRYSFQVISGSHSFSMGGQNPSFTLNIPESFSLFTSTFTVSQDMTVDISLPLKRVGVHVQDSVGVPVASARIMTSAPPLVGIPLGGSLTGSNGGGYSTITTNGAGDATLWLFAIPPNMPQSTYTITATPPTGSTLSTTSTDVRVTTDTTVTLTLVRPVIVSGTLRDVLGNGVPGQQISIPTPGSNQASMTDANGHYSLQTSPGSHNLSISGQNSAFTLNIPESLNLSTSAFSASQDTTVDISLPLKRVGVHVQDATGAPVASTSIATSVPPLVGIPLGGTLTGSNGGGYSTITTNGAGDVLLWLFPIPPNMPQATYTITATPPIGSAFSATSANVVVTADTAVTITLVHPVTVSGTLQDAVGIALPSQQVTLHRTGTTPQSVTTDPNGHYSFLVAPGECSLSTIGGNNPSFTLNIAESFGVDTSTFTVSQDTTVDISLPFKQVSLHIRDTAGAPIASTTIATSVPPLASIPLSSTLTGSSLTNGYSTITTNGAGDVTLWLFPIPPNMTQAAYTLAATPPAGSNYPVTTLSGLVLTADTSETIVLQTSIVTGSTAGGTAATFFGTGFQPGTQVFFDGVPAMSVTIAPGTSATRTQIHPAASASVNKLVAVPPAHGTGKVDVKIVNPDGLTVTIHNGYEFVTIATAPGSRPNSNGSSPGLIPPVPSARSGSNTGGGTPPAMVPAHR